MPLTHVGHHNKAAEHHEHAARHHRAAAEHYQTDEHEKAKHHVNEHGAAAIASQEDGSSEFRAELVAARFSRNVR